MTDLSVFGHAFFVLFAASFFIVSAFAYVVSFSADKYIVKYQARLLARWCLWIASVTTLTAIVFGLYAYSVVSHGDLSHVILNEHRNAGLLVGLLGVVLGLWVLVLFNDDKDEGLGFLALHLIAAVAVLYVSWTGFLLVYQYGVGVSRLPVPESHNHRTFDQITAEGSFTSILKKLTSQ